MGLPEKFLRLGETTVSWKGLKRLGWFMLVPGPSASRRMAARRTHRENPPADSNGAGRGA